MPKRSKSMQSGQGPSARTARALATRVGSEGVPPFKLATLVYPLAFTSSSVSGGDWYWQWRLNSLFDPDFTGGGQQPTTFDQWMALYDRYRVLSAEVDVICYGADASVYAFCGAPSADAAPTLDYQGILGMRDGLVGKSVPAGNFTAQRIKRTFLIKDVLGINEEALLSEINYSGTSSTSAPAVAYFNIGGFCSSGSTGVVMVAGEIRFGVRFEAPRANNVSLARDAAREVIPSASSSPLQTVTLSSAEAQQVLEVRAVTQSRAPGRQANSPGGFLAARGSGSTGSK